MIVLKVDLADHRTCDSESQPMIARDREAPCAFAVALERVKPPSRKRRQLTDILGFLDGGQHCAKLCRMLPRNTAHLITSPEPLQVPVAKTDDAHCATYAMTVQVSIDIDLTSPPAPARSLRHRCARPRRGRAA